MLPSDAFCAAVDRLIERAGSQRRLAAELGIDVKDIGRATRRSDGYGASHMAAAQRVAQAAEAKWPGSMFPPMIVVESRDEWTWIQLGRDIRTIIEARR